MYNGVDFIPLTNGASLTPIYVLIELGNTVVSLSFIPARRDVAWSESKVRPDSTWGVDSLEAGSKSEKHNSLT